ncbi:MAG: putative baseplate assembly protein [Bryobacteraceae bacterium]
MSLCCQKDERRDAVRRLQGWNGIDYIEVGPDQRTLNVFFLGKLPPEFSADNPALPQHLLLEGGERITGIQITDVDPVVNEDPELDDFLVVKLDRAGDFSRYTLSLIGVEKVDPRYGSSSFTFKIDCPSDLDCAPACGCEPPVLPQPEINYLAKDYASFRQLIFDRMALLVPGWQERHVPDLGVALVETLAYEGDALSYYQDAVATEAYLDTARLRRSVRRHVRLVDYQLHEGCNARALLAVEVDSEVELDASRVSFITGMNDALTDKRTILEWDDLREVSSQDYEVFEPFPRQGNLKWIPAHSTIRIYTWGNKECCLKRGATSTALLDTGLDLKSGDLLIFEEVLGPVTGAAADADPTHRHAVRLTNATKGTDPVVLDAEGQPTPYVLVEWAAEDALPIPYCVSAIGGAPACQYINDITVVRGNVLVVDHGRTWDPEDLGTVVTRHSGAECLCAGRPADVVTVPGPYSPALSRTQLTFRAPLDPANAAALSLTDPRAALPQVWLTSQPPAPWEPRYDLVASMGWEAHYVVEIDDNGIAHLRFGDGQLGKQPAAGMAFQAAYRTGNGIRGNVGPEAISRLVLTNLSLSGVGIRVRNPLPAAGGQDAEPTAEAKLFAPHLFRKCIDRAIIAADYEEIAERNPAVQNASAELVWTGSWYEADVAIDPFGVETLSTDMVTSLTTYLEKYRRMGHDLHVEPAVYVPLHLELEVCALPGYQKAHVRAALLDVFSNRRFARGVKGFFHPDNLTFGEGIYLSVIIATAQAVPGVECVTVTQFHHLFLPPNKELENGLLPLTNNEIARLDNDPDYPEHGKLVIKVNGGR